MLLKSITGTNEYGKEMITEYYGHYDEKGNEVITGTRKMLLNPEPTPQPTPVLSETEQAVLDTAVDVEYLVCLKDMDL